MRLQEAGMLGGGAEISAEVTRYAHISNIKPDSALEKAKLALPYPQLFIVQQGKGGTFRSISG